MTLKLRYTPSPPRLTHAPPHTTITQPNHCHPPLQGVTLKLRYTRSGHLFEFPLLLLAGPPTAQPGLLAAAYALPPLLYLGAKHLVVGPLGRAIQSRK